ncbi:MAG: tripartite tricarboxylate transporter substrate binding protein [Burkholderiales bacterium]|nr:tripartite tricarboxylate transporter substrate binding protein [Burkholderiales bacterium]
MKIRHWLAGVLGAVCAAGALAQQAFPAKPIKFVIPFTAGSATDIIGRSFGEVMSRSLGQPIVVENRTGAGGTIAAGAVAKSDADGYTLLVHSSAHSVNPAIYAKLPYDTLKDFINVAGLGAVPNVLIAPPGRYKDLRDFIAQVKAKPANSLNYGSAGIGSATHLSAEKFMMMAALDLQHVPFKGTPEVVTEVAAGRLEFYMAPINAALGLIKEGRVAALGVTSAKRAPVLPDVPATSEIVPGSDYSLWVGMFAPTGTPAAVVTRLNGEVARAAGTPELRERLAKMGADPIPGSAADFDRFVRAEIESAAQVAKRARIPVQQ